MVRPALLLLAALAACGAAAQDYARERRLEREIVPALVVGEPVRLRLANGREFLGLHTAVAGAGGAVVLVHGRNVHPDHDLIGVLRMGLADLGFTTLSIQMPVLGPEAQRVEDYYPALFPEAAERIGAAAAWLRGRGERRIALLSHSMGSWMANEYFDAHPDSPFEAWVCLGLTGGFSWGTYGSPRPVLDVFGESDLPSVADAAWRRRLALATAASGSKQARVDGADHFFTGRHSALARLIAEWLEAALKPPG
jgi:pimeloyl-ACP methyl ester carboxylesterase